MHKPIYLQAISLSFAHKTCFSDFSHTLYFRQRIAIIGRNGCGKSSLLKLIAQLQTPVCGEITIPNDAKIAYVPQLIAELTLLSGAERFQTTLTKALATQPNILLLDEPTNHLDELHKQRLISFIQHFPGTVIIATHDEDLLASNFDQFWHIENGQIQCFSGHYSDLVHHNQQQKQLIVNAFFQLKNEKKALHQALMKEQQRHASSRKKGEKSRQQKKWAPVIANTKSQQAQKSAGKKQTGISLKNQKLSAQLDALYIPEVLTPNFHLTSQRHSNKMRVEIHHGIISYMNGPTILSGIHLTLNHDSRVAIVGPNGSGKSTLLQTIYQNSMIEIKGSWQLPNQNEIGFLDQHYAILPDNKTVFEALEISVPHWSSQEIRQHLNDFLFRKNQEVFAPISALSGGEKARLSLALIAANPPNLLILDEVTNNLDRETRKQLIQVLSEYPSALLVVSHDTDFLQQIGITEFFSTTHFMPKSS